MDGDLFSALQFRHARSLRRRRLAHARLDPAAASDDLSRALGELALKERWPLLELHTEEGRLDEVFRSITLPDTKTEKEVAE